jgi:hypothetical protein
VSSIGACHGTYEVHTPERRFQKIIYAGTGAMNCPDYNQWWLT